MFLAIGYFSVNIDIKQLIILNNLYTAMIDYHNLGADKVVHHRNSTRWSVTVNRLDIRQYRRKCRHR